jgi:hypothetical protein
LQASPSQAEDRKALVLVTAPFIFGSAANSGQNRLRVSIKNKSIDIDQMIGIPSREAIPEILYFRLGISRANQVFADS